jgi:hypothetical protein
MKKKLAFLAIILGLTGCATYPRLKGPVRMNYAVHVNDESGLLGYFLCENYRYSCDTMLLYNAGYYSKLRWQRAVTNIWYYGDNYQYYIVDLQGTGKRYNGSPPVKTE